MILWAIWIETQRCTERRKEGAICGFSWECEDVFDRVNYPTCRGYKSILQNKLWRLFLKEMNVKLCVKGDPHTLPSFVVVPGVQAQS